MDISIITPVYNDPRLAGALNSILSQKGISGLEVIVVDGGSTDETIDVIEDHRDDIDVLVREPDDGIYDGMNKGIRRSNGELVGVLNADDRYHDEYVLRDVISKMEETGAQTCYGDLVYVDDRDNITRYWKSGPYRSRRFYYGWMPPHPTFFVRKGIYERYGLFDLEYQIAADYELLLRFLLKNDVSITYVDRVLVRMATGGRSNDSVSNIIKANWEVARAWRNNDLRGGLFVGFVKPLRKIPQYFKGTSPTLESMTSVNSN